MKKLSILAAALLFAGAANAQAPTNQYQGVATRPVNVPTNPNTPNGEVTGTMTMPGGFNPNYQAYSQDSYINQAGNGNNATVDQTDGRMGANRANGGSTAVIDQTGNRNTANQQQTLVDGSNFSMGVGEGRNFVKSTQAGTASQSDQKQTSGGYNKLVVLQGAGTTGNRAIQTQSIDGSGRGAGNQGTIEQTNYTGFGTSGGNGNRAEQDQSGYNQKALIRQESDNSFAKQTQRDGATTVTDGNSADIHQGLPGNKNTAIQDQTGVRNTARIQQGVDTFPTGANNNFARQTQSNSDNQADIDQKSSNNYAEQIQTGMANYSRMSQSNVSSAAYSIQGGNNNSASVTQH